MKTAVRWLKEQYIDRGETIPSGVFQEALEKEQQQMLDFGLYVKKNGWVGCKIEDMFEDYNNQNKNGVL